MKRLNYYSKNNFEFESFEKRTCLNKEVEIETKVLGLCGSDIQKFLRQTPDKGYLKTKILGHEIMGIVTNVGNECSKFNIGDRVVVNPFILKDESVSAQSLSLIDCDIVGRSVDGGFSEVLYLPECSLAKLSDKILDEEAVFIDDIAVVLHAKHYANEYIKNPNKIAVIGDGSLGILCYKVFSLYYGKNKVVIFSKNKSKLEHIKYINIEDYDSIEKYNESFDLIVEAVGGNQSSTLNSAILIGKPNSVVLCLGVYPFGYEINIDGRKAFYKQMLIKGINSYCNIHDDFGLAAELLERKEIDVSDMITNNICFSEFIDYLRTYESTKDNKIKSIIMVKK